MKRIARLLALVAVVACCGAVGGAAGHIIAGTLLDDFVEEIERELDEIDDILDEIDPQDPTLADDVRDWVIDTRALLLRILDLSENRVVPGSTGEPRVGARAGEP